MAQRATVTLSGMTITKGYIRNGAYRGGGILNNGTLTVSNSHVVGNGT